MRDLAAGGDHRVEVARGLAEDEVARTCRPSSALTIEVGRECRARARSRGRRTSLFSLPSATCGADARRRVEAGDARAAGAQPLGERALRSELHLELAGQELALELLVLADVGRDHLLDLPGLGAAVPRPKSSTPALFETMVRSLTPLATQRLDQFSGIPHRPNPPAARVMPSKSSPSRALSALG